MMPLVCGGIMGSLVLDMHQPRQAYPPEKFCFSVKVSGLHWHVRQPDRMQVAGGGPIGVSGGSEATERHTEADLELRHYCHFQQVRHLEMA